MWTHVTTGRTILYEVRIVDLSTREPMRRTKNASPSRARRGRAQPPDSLRNGRPLNCGSLISPLGDTSRIHTRISWISFSERPSQPTRWRGSHQPLALDCRPDHDRNWRIVSVMGASKKIDTSHGVRGGREESQSVHAVHPHVVPPHTGFAPPMKTCERTFYC